MSQYVDGMVAPVKAAEKQSYTAFAKEMSALFKEYGALSVVDCWGDEVPDGKLTSFPMAIKLEQDEVVCFSWILWPDKATHDEAWPKLMADPLMSDPNRPAPPFDGKRMIFGGFEIISSM